MKFHIVSLAHTRVEREFESCAFTQKVRKFANMMSELGHETLIYAPESENPYVVSCLSEAERGEIVGEAQHYTRANWGHRNAGKFLDNAIEAIGRRIAPGDFVCLIGGNTQKRVADAFGIGTTNKIVEFGIGYGGSFAQFRVFESSAWMHLTYGAEGGRNPNAAKASWYDDVIPNYFESETLPLGTGKGDYVAFLGRLNIDKGIFEASQVAKALGREFRFAGPMSEAGIPEYGEYLGELQGKAKADFLGNAGVVLCPSHYIEPFCGVAVEAMLCGTPVVTSDFGAFRETVALGRSGFRARTMPEFVKMTEMTDGLDRRAVRDWALQFDCKRVALRYQHYFERLAEGDWYGRAVAG